MKVRRILESVLVVALIGTLLAVAGALVDLASPVEAQSTGAPVQVRGVDATTGRNVPIQSTSPGKLDVLSFGDGDDPCRDANVPKVAIAVTATGQQVALSGTTRVHVCSLFATLGGTSPTATLQSGTGANCGTGTVSYSGALAPAPNGTVLSLANGGALLRTSAGHAFCVTLAGTTPTIAGILTYVQQ